MSFPNRYQYPSDSVEGLPEEPTYSEAALHDHEGRLRRHRWFAYEVGFTQAAHSHEHHTGANKHSLHGCIDPRPRQFAYGRATWPGGVRKWRWSSAATAA